MGERRIYCGQHLTYILWVTHNIYVVHPQHIRAAPTRVTHNIIAIILWETYCGNVLWVQHVCVVGASRICCGCTNVYIVGNVRICCGEHTYILWVTCVYIVGTVRMYCG